MYGGLSAGNQSDAGAEACVSMVPAAGGSEGLGADGWAGTMGQKSCVLRASDWRDWSE